MCGGFSCCVPRRRRLNNLNGTSFLLGHHAGLGLPFFLAYYAERCPHRAGCIKRPDAGNLPDIFRRAKDAGHAG